MSGIMAAVVGTVTASNIIYGAGLYNNVTGADLSPISSSASNSGTISRTWIGYFTPATTATVALGLQTTAIADFDADASTTGQLWVGSGAISGSGGANVVAVNNQTSSANFAMTQGVYYPIRIQWDGDYDGGFFGGDASGSITFFASASSNVSGRIFYNTVTNGF